MLLIRKTPKHNGKEKLKVWEKIYQVYNNENKTV